MVVIVLAPRFLRVSRIATIGWRKRQRLFLIDYAEIYRGPPISWCRLATTWKSAKRVACEHRSHTVFLHDRVGTPVNWMLSAVGRAYLAYCPEKERERILTLPRKSDLAEN